MRLRFLLCLVVCVLGGAAQAQNIALIIGNEDYRQKTNVRRGADVLRASSALEDAGVQVVERRNANLSQMNNALSELVQMAPQAEGLLVILSGRLVHTQAETYYLPVDEDGRALAGLAGSSLPISTVLGMMAEMPGRAVLALATDRQSNTYGRFLRDGVGDLALPQGVTLVTGSPRGVLQMAAQGFASPGQSIAALARRIDAVSTRGYLPDSLSFLDIQPEPEPEEEPVAPVENPDAQSLRDLVAWRRADGTNTAEGYRQYLQAYPNGTFARMAQNRLQNLDESPEARAKRIEESLDLSRDQRRDIQRDLSLLDFDTRGIDGIFGRGSRAAVAQWQTREGFDATGYLTRDQIARLDGQAERRATELEAEAAERRRQQLADDQAFWSGTGASGDEAGLRAYLSRYPDGEFSETAEAELAAIERQKRRSADAFDRQSWDRATTLNTVASYREYLRVSPNGAFASEAEARIARIIEDKGADQRNSAAAREENALNLNANTRRVVEQRLAVLGLKPGPIDGQFDDDTRRALRIYQRSRRLPETGYLTQTVVVRLLADSVRSIFQ